MKNEYKQILLNLEKLNLELKFPYETDNDFYKILLKITKEKKSLIELHNLSYEIDKNSIFILKNKKIVRIYDNYITDLTNYKDLLYNNIITINEKGEEKRYTLGYISENFEGFISEDNKIKSKKIIIKFIETFYNDFI